ncbi:FAD-dependent oxidoreductase [Sediminibacterium sp.]|uniref:FAD-dependent oxidoreductase n=1 Tax=Sediminibacterium sp. TaxID=1917865 RepID=UPI002737691E|nr:FAD-dependent oxidoreductase [Sediminibacterium sp.]MDP3394590.1 FAD-dependent oxidoreductase [Sediminibacterium sp.]MDP3568425.1 FAD-dependent oxidoreductase [Sediminibacterium sp.]
MQNKFRLLLCLLSCLCIQTIRAQKIVKTDVLVVGASASGIAAGIQSARMVVNTIIAEPSTWLGGMITAAGVCAFDGNHNLPSGIFGEFRAALYKVYGGPSKVATGWVSNTLFEPHIGDSIFKTMAASTKNLTVKYQLHFQKTIVENGVIKGAEFTQSPTSEKLIIYAKQVIDATELGDVLASAGVPYDLGMESNEMTHENVHKGPSNNIVQDITYVAILKDYGAGKDCTILRPPNYDPAEFDGACTDYYFDKAKQKPSVDAQKMLNYGKLPNNKYMINWPGYGNDLYLNVVEMKEADRNKELIKAKEQTQRFIYFIQHQLGFKQLGLANDEYPTKDRFPLIPYHRESRRVKGLVRMDIHHIAKPFQIEMPLYRTGIAVGDYPIDHHHKKNPDAPQHLDFYGVPSFNIPLGVMIPVNAKGLIIAEKSISVSNVVNGTTRLQAIALLIGQAAGTLAAAAAKENISAEKVAVRKVQAALLASNAYIMPYFDVPLTHPHFEAVQKIGATGILKGQGVPTGWANRTYFHPDSLVKRNELVKDMAPYHAVKTNASKNLHLSEAIDLIMQMAKIHKPFNRQKAPPFNNSTNWNYTNKQLFTEQIKTAWVKWKLGYFNEQMPLTRIELAVLLNETINPFALKQIDHQGRIIE